ncbi:MULTISPECIES: MCE family protein [unclassified Mycolicibacterium]|uniref:MCE family protein n=1 Tax=unclassified Mycolicibacterium TaxID=2636767 RepID=UPI0012DDE8A4|nr:MULTISPECIES: MCE family protein [unclassified Mycolicibacterium]MUL81877.1 MCE family protein [Mycolicibacterium sp. CBMA 329]MUL87643.1 MCE family protein [Mycolicibacterium sp. CBMA 331]MUL99493.1 MCE family protein [Mycolicibacterium sp. CBMA 334]MUM26421.1 MCE family protein [Mycolicibacterium sp. CBMA 295]MUM37940.1 MCE family protein [Mycolicibacterium sp. CBMA 247]
MSRDAKRLLTGLTTLVVIAAIITGAIVMFRGGTKATASVTVISPRAGLVMNPDAKVKLHGAQVGKVVAIDSLPDGQAAIRLAMNPGDLQLIPANTGVEIASSTVFGAKFVQLVPPTKPSQETMYAGQVLDAGHTTVEINTVFEQLVSVLSQIQPEKLNETLGALAQAFDGRGDKLGQTMVDLDSMLAKIAPSLPTLRHEMAVAPHVFNAYADAGQDLVDTVRSATQLSDTVFDRRNDLDAVLLSAIGLADIGNDVVATNSDAVTDAMRLLVPTTNLLNQYNPALTCGLKGLEPLAMGPPVPLPGVMLLDSFLLGTERYRYPSNLPKVAATGGSQCMGLPEVGFEHRPPFVVTDINANPAQYGNQGILLNSDGLKQALYGPIDGPPRNTTQTGQPG